MTNYSRPFCVLCIFLYIYLYGVLISCYKIRLLYMALRCEASCEIVGYIRILSLKYPVICDRIIIEAARMCLSEEEF